MTFNTFWGQGETLFETTWSVLITSLHSSDKERYCSRSRRVDYTMLFCMSPSVHDTLCLCL